MRSVRKPRRISMRALQKELRSATIRNQVRTLDPEYLGNVARNLQRAIAAERLSPQAAADLWVYAQRKQPYTSVYLTGVYRAPLFTYRRRVRAITIVR